MGRVLVRRGGDGVVSRVGGPRDGVGLSVQFAGGRVKLDRGAARIEDRIAGHRHKFAIGRDGEAAVTGGDGAGRGRGLVFMG